MFKWIRRCFLVALVVLSVLGLQRIYEKSLVEYGIKQLLGVVSPGEFRAYILGSQKVNEHATLQFPMIVQGFSSKSVWPVNSKMTIQGVYIAKIGFDLSKRFQLDIDAWEKSVSVRLPDPTVLSVERQDLSILGHDQSFLTSMSPEELVEFQNAMDRHARASIETNEVALFGAIDNLQSDMLRFSSTYGYTVNLQVDDDHVERIGNSSRGIVVEGEPEKDLSDGTLR
ncbi:MAG: DUF4230 domain-containing protein [Pirellulaceae bacterium]|nr:DUF4230 domain-containing protein [Pirellulaceae bacterium]